MQTQSDQLLKWRSFNIRSLLVDVRHKGDTELLGTACVQLPIAYDTAKSRIRIEKAAGRIFCDLVQRKASELPRLPTNQFCMTNVFSTPGQPLDTFYELRSTVCDVINETVKMNLGRKVHQPLKYMHGVSSPRVGAAMLVRSIRCYKDMDGNLHPVLDIAFLATPFPHIMDQHDGPVRNNMDQLMQFTGGTYFMKGTTRDTDELVLMLAEELELNSLMVVGSSLTNEPGQVTVGGAVLTETFLMQVTRSDQVRVMDYRLKTPDLMRRTPILRQIQAYRKLVGWAPDDSFFVCVCCGKDLTDDATLAHKIKCNVCKAVAFCSASCATRMMPMHEELCRFVDPTEQVRVPAATGFFTLGESLRLTQDERSKIAGRVQKLLRCMDADRSDLGFSRVAVGGSFAQHTAMVYDYGVDLVLQIGTFSVRFLNCCVNWKCCCSR